MKTRITKEGYCLGPCQSSPLFHKHMKKIKKTVWTYKNLDKRKLAQNLNTIIVPTKGPPHLHESCVVS